MPTSCAKCHQDIVPGQPIQNALDKNWHVDCFVCDHCRKPFTGVTSFVLQNGAPMHEECAAQEKEEETSDDGKCCAACHKPFGTGEPIVSLASDENSEQYHQRCFVCANCKKPFQGTSFVKQGDKPIHPECMSDPEQGKTATSATKSLDEKCYGCGQAIQGTRKIIPQLGHFHPDCLKCGTCQCAIKDTTYFIHPETEKPTCKTCIDKYRR